MATRNRIAPYKKKRDALKSVRVPLSSSASGSTGPVIEIVSGLFLRSNHSSYTPLSTEDPGPFRYVTAFLFRRIVVLLLLRANFFCLDVLNAK